MNRLDSLEFGDLATSLYVCQIVAGTKASLEPK